MVLVSVSLRRSDVRVRVSEVLVYSYSTPLSSHPRWANSPDKTKKSETFWRKSLSRRFSLVVDLSTLECDPNGRRVPPLSL